MDIRSDSSRDPETGYGMLFGEPALHSGEGGGDPPPDNPIGVGEGARSEDHTGEDASNENPDGAGGTGSGPDGDGSNGRGTFSLGERPDPEVPTRLRRAYDEFGKHVGHAASDTWTFYLRLRTGEVIQFSHAEPNFEAGTLVLHNVSFVAPKPDYAVSKSGSTRGSATPRRSRIAIGADNRQMTVRWEHVVWVCESAS